MHHDLRAGSTQLLVAAAVTRNDTVAKLAAAPIASSRINESLIIEESGVVLREDCEDGNDCKDMTDGCLGVSRAGILLKHPIILGESAQIR